MQAGTAGEYRVRLWVPGDWNAFFGFFTNVALNVIVLTGLSLGVVKIPSDIVFGRILPALGIALPIGNIYYAYLAYQLAKRERRDDVAALPYGPSVPQFVIGLIVVVGAFVGPTIRRYTPRAAMLGSLAGTALAFISMRPAFQSWELPWIAFISLGIVMISWMARVRLPWGVPGGLAAVVIGTAIGWITAFLGWSGYMQPTRVGQAL